MGFHVIPITFNAVMVWDLIGELLHCWRRCRQLRHLWRTCCCGSHRSCLLRQLLPAPMQGLGPTQSLSAEAAEDDQLGETPLDKAERR